MAGAVDPAGDTMRLLDQAAGGLPTSCAACAAWTSARQRRPARTRLPVWVGAAARSRRRLPAKSPTASDAAPRRPPPAPGPDQQRRDEANGPPSPAMSSLTARHDSTQIRSCEGREALSGGSPVRDRGSATPLARASRRHPRSQLVERSGARAFIPGPTPDPACAGLVEESRPRPPCQRWPAGADAAVRLIGSARSDAQRRVAIPQGGVTYRSM